MGLFDLFKTKKTGIDDLKFNSKQFQNEVCALSLYQLEKNNGDPAVAIIELKKIGLNDLQVESILDKGREFLSLKRQKHLNEKGIDESIFNSDAFQKELLDKSYDFYCKNKHNYKLTGEWLFKQGLNIGQSNQILKKLQIRMSELVDDFQAKMDSGEISAIKIKPSAEHVKGDVEPDQVDRYIAYGCYQMERDDLDNALELFDKAIELDENATLAFANKGILYHSKADHSKALYFYNKALAIEPNHIPTLENKMDLLFDMMNKENEHEFINAVNAVLKYNPLHQTALIYIIQYYLKEQDLEKALKSVKILFANYHGEDFSIQYLLLIFNKLPTDRALNEFAIYRNEISDQAQYQLDYCKGLFFLGIHDYDNGIITFENLNKKHEFSWNYYQIAIAKNFQNKTDECLAFLKKTFELEPGLKEDAKEVLFFENLSTNITFIELTR